MVSFFTAAGQPLFTSRATVGIPVWQQPFPEQTGKIVFRQRFWRTQADFTPIALNTTYPAHGQYGVPTSASYYLVAIENQQDERAGVTSWDEVYATVPGVRFDFPAAQFRFPAIIGGLSIGAFAVLGAGNVAPYGGGRMFLGLTGAAPGDRIVLSYQLEDATRKINVVYVRDYAGSGVVTFAGVVADEDPDFVLSTTTARQWARATATAGRQEPLDTSGRGVIKYTYTLCTAGVQPTIAFQSRQKFTRNGEEVDFVSADTSPSAAVYAGWVNAGTTFRTQDDEWGRWMGNIFEIRETAIAAQ